MINSNLRDCVGCRACMEICPKGAICFQEDKQGFSVPVIDEDKCINCGLCDKVCQIGGENSLKNNKATRVWGIKNCDSIRKKSSSGGIFTAAAQDTIKNGGVVFGAAFQDDMQVCHIMVDTVEDIDKLRGSKYVQSNMGTVYSDILKMLQDGRMVLFSGTPCQVAAVRKYLSTRHVSTDKLLTIDLICHGVPSPFVWKEYIDLIEKKFSKKIVEYSFRDKENGWKGYHIKIVFEDGSVIRDTDFIRSFVTLFSNDLIIRQSCFFCEYASTTRCGDITIGDFWGLENVDKAFWDNKGVSMVIPNSEKGERAITNLCEGLDYKEYDTSCLTQPNLHKSSDFGEEYDSFWNDYYTRGIYYVLCKYGKAGKVGAYHDILRRIRRKLSRL